GPVAPRILPTTVQIGRPFSSLRTVIVSVAGPRPTRYGIGRPPCQWLGEGGPPSDSRMTRASLCDIGTLTMAGSDTASEAGIRFAPAIDAQPGVSGSPGTRKSYATPPRWMWLSAPPGPCGYTLPFP